MQGPFLPIQGFEFLSRRSSTDNYPVFPQQVVVERMQRLTQLHHHVVCGIDDIVDAPHIHGLQSVRDLFRCRADLNAGHDPRTVAWTPFGILCLNTGHGLYRSIGLLEPCPGLFELLAVDHSEFPRHSEMTQPVGPVRCNGKL